MGVCTSVLSSQSQALSGSQGQSHPKGLRIRLRTYCQRRHPGPGSQHDLQSLPSPSAVWDCGTDIHRKPYRSGGAGVWQWADRNSSGHRRSCYTSACRKLKRLKRKTYSVKSDTSPCCGGILQAPEKRAPNTPRKWRELSDSKTGTGRTGPYILAPGINTITDQRRRYNYSS